MSNTGSTKKGVDFSQYVEKDDDEDPQNDGWDDVILPKSGLSLPDSGRRTSIASNNNFNLETSELTDNSDFQAANFNPIVPAPALTDGVAKFLSSYKGSGTVTRLSGNKRSGGSEHSDWDDDLVIPQSGFPMKPRTMTDSEDLDAFLTGEQDPLPSRASTFSRFSNLNSVEEERSEEEDFQLPNGDLQLQLSPPPDDATYEIKIDEDNVAESYSEPSYDSTRFKDNPSSLTPFTPESSTENWDDVEFPKTMKDLRVAERKPYRPISNREDNWLEDLEVPNDNVFAIKAEQNRFLKRKPTAPATRILKRNTINLDLFTLPHMLPQAGSSSFPYARKALRQKKTSDSFITGRNFTPTSTASRIGDRSQALQESASPSSSMEFTPLSRAKIQIYGDGTELDDFDNLPISAEVDGRYVQSNKIQKLNPPSVKIEAASEKYAQLLSHFSEIEVQKSPNKINSKGNNKPHLIQNLNSLKVERVVGEMRFNPQAQRWDGNEAALKDFDSVSPPRPALITNLNGNKRPRRVGNMIFDPELMRWCSTEEEDDPFAHIPDFPGEDTSISKKPSRAGFAPGDSFYLSANYIDSMYAAERQHRQFMSQWSLDNTRTRSNPNSGSGPVLRGVGHDHLHEIRHFPAYF